MFSDKVQNNNQGEAYQCLFHPTNVDSAALVTVIGSSINRVLKLVVENREGMLKSVGYGMGKVGEAQSKLLTCHAWLIDGDKERMLLGTEMGEVYVLDPEHQWEPVKVLQGPEGVAASCIVPYSSGKAFVVGGTSGTLMFYAAQDNEKDPYRFVRSVQIRGETGAIRSISIPQSEEHVVLTTSTNQMWIMELGNTEAQTKADESPVRLLAAPFHRCPSLLFYSSFSSFFPPFLFSSLLPCLLNATSGASALIRELAHPQWGDHGPGHVLQEAAPCDVLSVTGGLDHQVVELQREGLRALCQV